MYHKLYYLTLNLLVYDLSKSYLSYSVPFNKHRLFAFLKIKVTSQKS